MESERVTTPFGRRPMTLGMLASQVAAREIEPARSVDKWKIYRALCEARPRLGITDRALAVLNALLSFYPKNELSQETGLVVFPSNAQLSLRAHGMAEQTIRRHIAVLVEVGLLIRHDSPNGKRYARRGQSGDLSEAYGFSLAPLLSRADEIEQIAAGVVHERLHRERLRERISLCRRDIAKLIDTARTEGLAGDWDGTYLEFRRIVESISRSPVPVEMEGQLGDLARLRDDVANRLEMLANTRKESGSPGQNERHIQTSNTDFIHESEPGFEPKQDAPLEIKTGLPEEARPAHQISLQRLPSSEETGAALKSFPLGLVLQACPDIAAYGPGGRVGSWMDLMAAAVVVRSVLGVSPSAYEQACAVMGPENAATVIACILERGGHIQSAGGYLRDLTRRTERGAFAIGPMLMALARSNGAGSRRTA